MTSAAIASIHAVLLMLDNFMGDAQLLSRHSYVSSDYRLLDVTPPLKFRSKGDRNGRTSTAPVDGDKSRRSDALPRRPVLHANPRRLRRGDLEDRAGRKCARRARRRRQGP